MSDPRQFSWLFMALSVPILVVVGTIALSQQISYQTSRRLDPAAWGGDHVGQPTPEYATGEQCLFCHRAKIGPTWSANRHSRTIRDLGDEPAARDELAKSSAKRFLEEIQFVMGDQRQQRFLKSARDYGKLELLSIPRIPGHDGKPGEIVAHDHVRWDETLFGKSCAGCHTTAVDSKTQAFSAVSLDCYVCHGDVPTNHANKRQLAIFSPAGKVQPRVVTSICAQCHVRTGKSKSSGRPYPNNFVAGDNLFRDLQVDLSDEALKKQSAADRHVLENVRDVVVLGQEAVTCLSCHDIHARSSQKHRQVAESDYCLHCHNADGFKEGRKPFTVGSRTCAY